MSVVLYSTGCPKCDVLKKKLADKCVQYIENSSVEEMKALGISLVPVLKVNGQMMGYKEAVDWVNGLGGGKNEHSN